MEGKCDRVMSVQKSGAAQTSKKEGGEKRETPESRMLKIKEEVEKMWKEEKEWRESHAGSEAKNIVIPRRSKAKEQISLS